jgi:hypothetical protein
LLDTEEDREKYKGDTDKARGHGVTGTFLRPYRVPETPIVADILDYFLEMPPCQSAFVPCLFHLGSYPAFVLMNGTKTKGYSTSHIFRMCATY